MKSTRSGFTLLELLVVISLIIAMTTLAIGAFGAFLASKQIQLAGRSVTNAYRAARQFAVSNRLPCLVQFIDVSEDGDPKNDNEADKLLVIPFDRVVDPKTGSLAFVLSVDPPLFQKELPGKVQFTLTPPKMRLEIHEDANNDGNWDEIDVAGMWFQPDGSVRSASHNDESKPDDTVELEDRVSKEKGRIYCYKVTGYTREWYDEDKIRKK